MPSVPDCHIESGVRSAFGKWTNQRTLPSLGTNSGALQLPFQRWHKFKEAFAPEIIERAVRECPSHVERCIDPFGGSGTTALACQFLGVHPVVAEINPYLADVIEAKLSSYSFVESLTSDLDQVINSDTQETHDAHIERFRSFPPTFVEPGRKGRWVFDRPVAERISALLYAIESLDSPLHQRLFRVLLGGVLVEVSNVFVSGKGRRYRRQWSDRDVPSSRVSVSFAKAATEAIEDIRRYSDRPSLSYELRRVDSRDSLRNIAPCELAVFSPPYPNSFDYTDVYNLELWMLGYLTGREANAKLRLATLSSHVQISRFFPDAPDGSPLLCDVISRLEDRRENLWNRHIPEMIGAYFGDLLDVLRQLQQILVSNGLAWIVVGDSCYAGIQVPVALILRELAAEHGWRPVQTDELRTIRTSAQQGGELKLSEQLLVLQNG